MKRIRRAFTLVFSLISVAALLAGCGATATVAPPPSVAPPTPPAAGPVAGGRLVYGLTLSPSGIDPHADASSELTIPLSSVYDTLVYQDRDGGFVPGLAESWEVSDDGRVYTFHLRRGVRFHDGTPFNAQAVQFNLDRIKGLGAQSRKAGGLLGPYERTEVVDEVTVRVVLAQPFAPLLDSLSQVYLGMASPGAVQQWGTDYQLHQVGTGPFVFREYVPNDHLTLVRFPDYAWAPAVYNHDGPAYLDEIEFRFYVDPAVRALALESGEAQVMGEVPPQDALRLESGGQFALHLVPIPGQPLQFFMNTARPPTDDLRVRQAILYATDRETIVSTIFLAYSPVAWAPLAAATMGYEPALVASYAYDPARAAALLDQAGWADADGDGVRDRDGQPLVLQAYLMTWGSLPEIGPMLQSQLRAVGIDLQLQTVAYPAAVEAASQGLHHLVPMFFSNSDPSVLNLTFPSATATEFNWSRTDDAELQRLLTAAVGEMDVNSRAALYSQAQQRIMDLALILPIRDYVNISAAGSTVRGLEFDRRGWVPWLHGVWLDGN